MGKDGRKGGGVEEIGNKRSALQVNMFEILFINIVNMLNKILNYLLIYIYKRKTKLV